MLARAAGGFLTWAPPFAVLALGFTWVARAWQAIPHYKEAFTITVDAGSSKVEARAWGIQLEAAKRTAAVTRVELYEPRGPLIAAGRDISGSLDSRGAVQAHVKKVWGRVDRLADGSFAIERYVKGGPAQPPSDQAFNVTVDEADLSYRDQLAKWNQAIRLRSIAASGFRDRLSGAARFQVPGYGMGSARIRSIGDLLAINGKADFDLSPFLGPLRRMKEGREIRELTKFNSRKLYIKGPYAINMKGAQTGFAATVSGSGEGVVFDEIRVERASFQGLVTDRGFAGRLKGDEPGIDADFQGTVKWAGEMQGVGKLVATIQSEAALPAWVRKTFPSDLRARGGKADGWVAWKGSSLSTGADFTLASASVAGQSVQSLNGAVAMNGDNLAVDLLSGRWQGAPATGAVRVQNAKPIGFVRSEGLNLSALRIDGLQGTARGLAFFQGTDAEIRATGAARYSGSGRRFDAGAVNLIAHLKGSQLHVDRAQARGPSGIAAARGSVDINRLTYAFDAVASGLPLGLLTDNQATGEAYYRGKITGRKEELATDGVAEAFDVEASNQKLAYVRANLATDPGRIKATEFLALGRAARATGSASIELKTQAIDGQFEANGIRLDQYPPQDVSGVAKLRNGRLSGTLQRPVIEAALEANSVVAYQRRFPRVTADLRVAGDEIDARNILAISDEGKLTGEASASVSQKSGSFSLFAENLNIAELAPELADTAIVKGGVGGRISGLFTPSGLAQLTADMSLDRVFVNDSFLGSGPVSVNFDGKNYTGSAFVGSLEQFLESPRFAFDPTEKTLDADVTAGNLPIEQLFAATRRYFEPADGQPPQVELSEKLLSQLRSARGTVNLQATTAGSIENPILDVQQFNVNDLTLEGNKAGNIAAKFSRTDKLWTLETLNWSGGPGALNASGTWDEKGMVDITGDLRDLQTDWFTFLFPELSNVPGGVLESDLFTIEGSARQPNLSAALTFTQKQGDEVDRQIDILARTTEGAITAEGSYFLGGFTGPLTARVPLQEGLRISFDEPISAEMKLENRTVASLESFLPKLNAAQSSGLVNGAVRLGGTLNKMDLRGELTLGPEGEKPATLAWDNGDLSNLTNVQAKFTLDPMSAILNASAESADGGSVTINEASVGLTDLDVFLRRGLDALLERPVGGSVSLNGFRMRYEDPKAGPLAATIDGKLDFSQTLAEPLVAGKLAASRLTLAIPEIAPTEGTVQDYLIDPRFDIDLDFSDPFSLSAGAGSFTMTGLGTLEGSLENPTLDSFFTVQRGFLRLPNARIAIEPDGGVRIAMRDGLARADLNLTGRTAVTAMSVTGTVERYDVTLGIRGNLLEANGLALTASADPPDLSQDRILALLGQRDLIAGIAAQSSASGQIQAALWGAAVPYLIGDFTDRLAAALNLDYLNLDYNGFDGFSLSAAMLLGKDFTLSARRQLIASFPGDPLKYEVKLSYRPSFAGRLGRRFSLSVGFDQYRPWKIGVEYGIRF